MRTGCAGFVNAFSVIKGRITEITVLLKAPHRQNEVTGHTRGPEGRYAKGSIPTPPEAIIKS